MSKMIYKTHNKYELLKRSRRYTAKISPSLSCTKVGAPPELRESTCDSGATKMRPHCCNEDW